MLERSGVLQLDIYHDFQVLLVKLEQILHLKADCSDFHPVRDRGGLPYQDSNFKSTNLRTWTRDNLLNSAPKQEGVM